MRCPGWKAMPLRRQWDGGLPLGQQPWAYMNEIRSIGVFPVFKPPEFQYSSAISTASEPRETLSAPERK